MNTEVSRLTPRIQLYTSAFALYLLDQILLKISMALFMLRIVRGRWQRRFIIGTMAIFVTYTTALIAITVFRCGLPSADGLLSATCTSNQQILQPLNYTAAAANAVMDWILTATPIFVICRLQMPTRAKLSASILIGLCALGSILSVVRIGYAADVVPSASFFSKDVPFMTLSLCETGIGMIAISFAALRPLLLVIWEKAKTVARTGQELDGFNTGNKLDQEEAYGIMEMEEVHELRTSKSPRCDSFDEEINVWSNITENKRSSYIDTRKTYIDYPSKLFEVRQFAVDTPMSVAGEHKSWVASPAGISIDGKSYMDFPSPMSDKHPGSPYASSYAISPYAASSFVVSPIGLSAEGKSYMDNQTLSPTSAYTDRLSPLSDKFAGSMYLPSPVSDKYPSSMYNALPSPMSERPISFIAVPAPGSGRKPSNADRRTSNADRRPSATDRRTSNADRRFSYVPLPSPVHIRAVGVLPDVEAQAAVWASEVTSTLSNEVPTIQPAPRPRLLASRSSSSHRLSSYRRSAYDGSRRSQIRQSLYRHSQCPFDLYQLGNHAGEDAPSVPKMPGSQELNG